MREPMIRINPRKGGGGEGAYDARVPLSAIRPGRRIRLPVSWCYDNHEPIRIPMVVREVSFARNWIRMDCQAGEQTVRECVKFAVEGAEA